MSCFSILAWAHSRWWVHIFFTSSLWAYYWCGFERNPLLVNFLAHVSVLVFYLNLFPLTLGTHACLPLTWPLFIVVSLLGYAISANSFKARIAIWLPLPTYIEHNIILFWSFCCFLIPLSIPLPSREENGAKKIRGKKEEETINYLVKLGLGNWVWNLNFFTFVALRQKSWSEFQHG